MLTHTSGLRRVLLPFLLPIALLLVACTQQTAPATQKLSSDPVVHWIQQNTIPLQTTNPGGSDADLAPLKQIVGNASIVGLGEGTHGTHEFINIKARLAEYLISNMSFTTFVMENDWGSSQLLDAYINGGSDSVRDAMTTSLFSSWQTQEYQALFEWMRAYNANAAHTTKIHFLGMDCQGLDQDDFDAVENYLQKVDPLQVAHVKDLYAPIIADGLRASDGFSYSYGLAASTKQQYQDQAQRVYDLLQARQQNYTSHSSPQSFALALQNARVLVQITTYLNRNTPGEQLARYFQRDSVMAENVAWIHDHEASANQKVIVWAHNVHIANDSMYPSQDNRNMGSELRARYSKSYLPIGTTFYQGTFRAYFYQSSKVQTIASAHANTYNYSLGQAGRPLYMLDLRTIPAGPVSNWARSKDILLSYGLGGENTSMPTLLSQSFAVIVHVQDTTPAEHF